MAPISTRIGTAFVLAAISSLSMAQEKQHFLPTDSGLAVTSGFVGKRDKDTLPPPIICTQDVDKNLCSDVKTLVGPLQKWTGSMEFFVVDEQTFKKEKARLIAAHENLVKAASGKTGPDHDIALARAMNHVPCINPIGYGSIMFVLNYNAPITFIDKVYISQDSFQATDTEGNMVGPVDRSQVIPVIMGVFRYAEGFSAGALRQSSKPKSKER